MIFPSVWSCVIHFRDGRGFLTIGSLIKMNEFNLEQLLVVGGGRSVRMEYFRKIVRFTNKLKKCFCLKSPYTDIEVVFGG